LVPLLRHSASSACFALFFVIIGRPPISTLFPYTTLFRSLHLDLPADLAGRIVDAVDVEVQVAAERLHHGAYPPGAGGTLIPVNRSEEHTSELQSLTNLVCRLLLEKKKTQQE